MCVCVFIIMWEDCTPPNFCYFDDIFNVHIFILNISYIQYSITLLPSELEVSHQYNRGMFCGAKYTHHTTLHFCFTPCHS